MANRERGEAEFEANGKTWRFRMSVNAQCELEARLSTPEKEVTFQDVIDGVRRRRATSVRAFLWAGLIGQHPGITFEEVGALIDEMGGWRNFLQKAMVASMPDPADVAALQGGAGGAETDPQKAAPVDGTGAASTTTAGAAA